MTTWSHSLLKNAQSVVIVSIKFIQMRQRVEYILNREGVNPLDDNQQNTVTLVLNNSEGISHNLRWNYIYHPFFITFLPFNFTESFSLIKSYSFSQSSDFLQF